MLLADNKAVIGEHIDPYCAGQQGGIPRTLGEARVEKPKRRVWRQQRRHQRPEVHLTIDVANAL